MTELPYHEQRDRKNEAKLQELLSALPLFCADFFRGIEPSTSSMTRLSYAYDIGMFFDFLTSRHATGSPSICTEAKPEIRSFGLSAKDFTMKQFRQISVTDLERYLEYLKYRPDDPDHRNTNKEQGIKRKFFSLKSFLVISSALVRLRSIPPYPCRCQRSGRKRLSGSTRRKSKNC